MPEKKTDPDRDALRAELQNHYTQGATVRDLAEDIGRSYGYVHRILTDDGEFQLRSRSERRKGESA
jgi:hypothetical protein